MLPIQERVTCGLRLVLRRCLLPALTKDIISSICTLAGRMRVSWPAVLVAHARAPPPVISSYGSRAWQD